MSTLQDLSALQARLATDVTNQTNDIALIQNNLTQQLTDLQAAVSKLQQAQPTLDLTSITMSLNQIESNHAALLSLAKQAAGIDETVLPPPAPVISTAPGSELPVPPPNNPNLTNTSDAPVAAPPTSTDTPPTPV